MNIICSIIMSGSWSLDRIDLITKNINKYEILFHNYKIISINYNKYSLLFFVLENIKILKYNLTVFRNFNYLITKFSIN